jgi:two-component system cell cycle sensor histidine kinase/response regulator CckA
MTSGFTPPLQDATRLALLADTGLLDVPAQAAFERMARLASMVLHAPIALVTLVDANRQFFTSSVGLPEPWASLRETPLSHSFCQHVVQAGEPLVIEDARTHPQVRDSLAIQDLGAVAYAGVPLAVRSGHVLGTLAVADTQPRVWTSAEIEILEGLAAATTAELEVRLARGEARRKASAAEERFQSLVDGLDAIVWEADARTFQFSFVNQYAEQLLGYSVDQWLTTPDFWVSIIHPDDRESAVRFCMDSIRRGEDHQVDYRVLAADGRVVWLRDIVRLVPDAAGRPHGLRGIMIDVTRCKQAEAALRESEVRSRAIAETASDVVVTVDEQGTICFVNSACERVFGYTREELLGQPLSVLTPESSRAWHQDGMLRYLAANLRSIPSNGLELTGLHKNGHTVPLEVSFGESVTSGGRFLTGFIRDVSDRRSAEEALRKSEEHWRSLIENALDIITILDADGIVRFESPSVERVLGYRPEQLVGCHAWEFVHPDDLPQMLEIFRTSLGNFGETEPVEFRFRHIDGSWRTLEAIGKNLLKHSAVAGIVINSRDITERKKTERALRETNQTLQALIEALPLAVIALDRAGTPTMWNSAAERIFGWKAEEVLGRSYPIVPDDRLEEHRTLFRAALERGEMVAGVETQRVRKDGSLVEVAIWSAPIRDAGGQVRISIDLYADVTERRHLEEQLRQAQKMDAVGRLAGGVAHDFNNLLTAIKGFGQLMLDDLEPADPLHGYAEQIQQATDRAASLTRQLLTFSRRQVLEPKVLDLNAVVANTNQLLGRLVGANIELRIVPDPLLGQVKVDPGQVEQMLMNLVVNARDAMPHGGTLTIETRNIRVNSEDARLHPGMAVGSYAMLAVSDTGCGMDRQTQARIFEPFFTTKDQGKGTGLGLSTVYGIVKQSGGHIWVYSEPGQGSIFKVYLPRVLEQAQAPAEEELPALPVSAGTETVLLVEDEEVVRVLARKVLQKKGYRVLEATNGADALLICRKASERIHLLLTDVVMPGMNGHELATQVVSLRPGIQVLYMSGYAEDAIVHHGVLDEGIAFLEKPLSPAGLALKLREVLDTPVEKIAAP